MGRPGRVVLVVGSLLAGIVAAVLVVVVLPVPPSTRILSAAVLAALSLGWVLLAVSARFSGVAASWAVGPAAFLLLAAVLTAVGGPAAVVFGWLWPALLSGLVAWMLVGIRRRVPDRLIRVLLYPITIGLAVVAVGGGFATVGRALSERSLPSAGRLVDVGEHRLYLACTGSGSPTVVLEPGLAATSTDPHWIAAGLARDTEVCVYDRAGRGWSDDADRPPDAAQVATDLQALLEQGRVRGPYVLAGHSFGGLYGLEFAARFPDRVAGLVLLDSTAPAGPSPEAADDLSPRLAALMPALARLGVPRDLASSAAEFLEGSASVREAGRVRTLGAKPLVVVTADTGHDASWRSAQQRLATLSTNSRHLVVHATHESLVADEDDAAAAAEAVRDVLTAVRTSRRLG